VIVQALGQKSSCLKLKLKAPPHREFTQPCPKRKHHERKITSNRHRLNLTASNLNCSTPSDFSVLVSDHLMISTLVWSTRLPRLCILIVGLETSLCRSVARDFQQYNCHLTKADFMRQSIAVLHIPCSCPRCFIAEFLPWVSQSGVVLASIHLKFKPLRQQNSITSR
jgi:hypothetical protein